METGRLELRPCRMDDLQIIHQLWTNDHIRHFLFDNQIISLDEARTFVERSIISFRESGYGVWLVHLRGNDQPIGFAGFLRSGETEPSLIYGIHPDHVGNGYATEAAGAVLNYGLRELRLPKVRADVDEPNRISMRVLEKLGMKQVERKIINGHWLLDYEITRSSDMA
jgi:[ribosomal protein S5]-alanine N-acetyltransferase